MMDYLERPQVTRSRFPVGEHRVRMKSLESHSGHDTYVMLWYIINRAPILALAYTGCDSEYEGEGR